MTSQKKKRLSGRLCFYTRLATVFVQDTLQVRHGLWRTKLFTNTLPISSNHSHSQFMYGSCKVIKLLRFVVLTIAAVS